MHSDQPASGEVLWRGQGTFDGEPIPCRIAAVDRDNLGDAVNILATGFPGELDMIFKSLATSILVDPKTLLLPGYENLQPGSLGYVLLYLGNRPAGVTGIYILKNHPQDAWMGWTALAPQVRGSGLVRHLVDWFENRARQVGCATVRAWSVDNRLRFGGMHEFLARNGYRKEIFQGARHGAGDYAIFSKSLTTAPTSPCPSDVLMAGGTESPLVDDTVLTSLYAAFSQMTSQRKNTGKRRAQFLARHGNAESFARDRIFDLTAKIRGDTSDCPDSLVDSFYQLNEQLFPIESERETPAGFRAYVQPCRIPGYPPNERRIIALLDDNREKVIGAAVFGVAATPDSLRLETHIDGVVGLTYIMLDEAYRGIGLGKHLGAHLIPTLARDFLSNQTGSPASAIIIGAETNDAGKLTMAEAIADMQGKLLLPHAQNHLLASIGFIPLKFNDYQQLKLRPNLKPLPLRFIIAGWSPAKPLPSRLAWYVIQSHAELCLNKQAGLDAEDAGILAGMKTTVCAQNTAELVPFQDYYTSDLRFLAAIIQAANQNPVPENELVSKILAQYSAALTIP